MRLKTTTVVVNPVTGQQVPLLAGRIVPAWAEPLLSEPSAPGYGDMTVEELRDEIHHRNEGRDDEQHLSAQGRKADLIHTLEADDRPNS